ncbi:DUF397 domain-containing protein [Nocardiopsis trehalosi]|uniref:DUF397 domain-containing protein n=1 Tax=Nocardiopsis trehalosi TaxID=109329 RepID=UPI00083234D8|nr:DUF397 domain-containing protein [Nocardiopsis trehalosi]
MAANDPQRPTWRTSSYSTTGGGQCVEVAELRGGMGLRDSKAPDTAVLNFPHGAWAAFIRAAARRHL